MVLRIVRSHHERLDGSGFPDGLSGDRDPAGGAHRRGGGCVRCDDHEPRVPARLGPRPRRFDELHRCAGHPLRPRGRGRVHRARFRDVTALPIGTLSARHSPSMSDTLMISVSGMRGHVGTDLTPELVARHAAALGAWARSGGPAGAVLPSCWAATRGPAGRCSPTPRPRVSCRSGWTSIDLGIVPTPTVQLAVEHHHAGAGLILTASHNPIEWNALKFVGPDGIFLDADAGARGARARGAGPAASGVGRARASCARIPEAVARHLDAVLALPVIDVAAIRGAALPRRARLRARRRRRSPSRRCSSGSAAGCSGINLETDGRFPRAPEPIPENLGELGRLVRETRRRHRDGGRSRRGPAGAGGRERARRSARTTRWRSRSARCWTDAAMPRCSRRPWS